MKGLPFAILPNFIGMIAVLDKDSIGLPVFFLLRQKGAAFQNENALPARSEALRESAATRASADNDKIVVGLLTFFHFGLGSVGILSGKSGGNFQKEG